MDDRTQNDGGINYICRSAYSLFRSAYFSQQVWMLVVSSLLVGFSAGYLGTQLKSIVDCLEIGGGRLNWYRLIASLILFPLLPIGVYLGLISVQKIIVPKIRRRLSVSKPEKREVLVFFLSKLNPELLKKLLISDPDQEFKFCSHAALQMETIDAELNALAKAKRTGGYHGLSWEQPLRAIRHHLPDVGQELDSPLPRTERSLKKIIVVASKESIQQSEAFFDKFLGRYSECSPLELNLYLKQTKFSLPVLLNWKDSSDSRKQNLSEFGWDFEDFNELASGLIELFRMLNKNVEIADSDIAVDYTSGTKVCTAVAATTTLNRKIKAQYVATQRREENRNNDHDLWQFDVLGHDIVIEE